MMVGMVVKKSVEMGNVSTKTSKKTNKETSTNVSDCKAEQTHT